MTMPPFDDSTYRYDDAYNTHTDTNRLPWKLSMSIEHATIRRKVSNKRISIVSTLSWCLSGSFRRDKSEGAVSVSTGVRLGSLMWDDVISIAEYRLIICRFTELLRNRNPRATVRVLREAI